MKQCILDFIWDGWSSKIAYDVIIQQIQDGVLKIIDFGEIIKSLKIIWMKRLTDGTPQRWKAAPAVFYNISTFSDYFSYHQHPKINISQFYQDVQRYWSQVQTIETCIAKEIFNQIKWNNRYITIKIGHWADEFPTDAFGEMLAIICKCRSSNKKKSNSE